MTAMETEGSHRDAVHTASDRGGSIRHPVMAELIAGIVQAHLQNNPGTAEDVADLIARVGEALRPYGGAALAAPPAPETSRTPTAPASPAGRRAAAPEHADWLPEGTFGPQRPPWAPAVDPADSHTYEHVICLEDGRPMQMLKRHLKKTYGMTPEQYVRKWGLPADYQLSSEKYRVERRKIAGAMGFQRGQAPAPKNKRRRPAAAPPPA